MENQEINTKLLALFSHYASPLTPKTIEEVKENIEISNSHKNSMDIILQSIENSLPELEALVPITHWKGSYISNFRFYKKDIEGKILSGFYEIKINNMKLKLIAYLNRTGQLKTRYHRIINHMVNEDQVYKWNINKTVEAWVDEQLSKEDHGIITNLMGNILFQIYRDGAKFVHAIGSKIIMDKNVYKDSYDKINEYLKQFGMTATGNIMDDTIFLGRDKFVRLGQGYEAKRIPKLNKV